VSKLLTGIRAALTRAEGSWFDVTRHVRTEGHVAVYQVTFTATGESGYDYVPTRPSVVRKVLARLPVQDLAEYTFVDLGSGKGRVLLVAAEYSFGKIRGVEFAGELHGQAEQNIARYRYAGRRCADVASIHADAMEYVFPESKLILYFHNPFSPEVMQKVFMNLGKSLAARPREVMVIMVNLYTAAVADSMPFLRLYCGTQKFRIYQAVNS
jgi:Histone methylation protein DOT1